MIKIQEMTDREIDNAKKQFNKKMTDKYGFPYGSKLDSDEIKESEKLACRDMMVSVLAYDCDPSMSVGEVVDILMNDDYIEAYISGHGRWSTKKFPLGYKVVLELAKEMANDYCGKAKLTRDVFTDSEGLSYNGLEW